ncbi:MAG: hypothetical protein RR547_02760 [Raoultibacter sp.]
MSDLVTDLMQDRDLMKKASELLKQRGYVLAKAEAEYQTAKNVTALIMKAEGLSATMIQLILKGDERVSVPMNKRDCARVEYDSAKEALNVYKLDARLLEAQIDREYRG